MQNGSGGKLILAFVTLLIGAVLLATVAGEGNLITEKKVISDEIIAFTPTADGGINTTEVHTVTYPPTGWKVVDCPLSAVTIGNASDDFTADTDYTLTASAGTFVFIDTEITNGTIGPTNSSLVDYTYCGDDYLNAGWGRTAVDITSGFFAIALLLVSVGLFFAIAKDEGIL